MAKVNIGKLKKMLKQQPEMETRVAYGIKAIVCNHVAFGEYATIMVFGPDDGTPEILMPKSELRRFANEILAKLDG